MSLTRIPATVVQAVWINEIPRFVHERAFQTLEQMERSIKKDHGSLPISDESRPSSPRRDEVSFVSALALIWRVIYGRRYALPEADAPDVAQEAALRLWKWSEKFQQRSDEMTAAEWSSFTAKTAHNEVNRYSASSKRAAEVPIDEAGLIQDRAPAGNADSEMFSLVREVWQEICRLSLYQRRALLLSSIELLIYFLQFGISESAVVASLEITEEEWPEIAGRMPLSDNEIAAIARPHRNALDQEASCRAIKKARFDARTRLKELMNK